MSSAQQLKYKPYQEEGIEFMASRRATLLADEQGLGKTVQVVGLINETLPQDVLIVCPAVVKVNWIKEVNKWCDCAWLDVNMAEGSYFPKSRIVIINYDILSRHKKEILGCYWDLVVFDESQRLANRETNWTKVAMRVDAGRVVCMSGTPIPNRIKDLWPTLHILDCNRWPDYYAFTKRYAGGHYEYEFNKYTKRRERTWWDKGASNQLELRSILQDTVMLRREQSEVLTLPPFERHIITAPPSSVAKGCLKRREELSSISFTGEIDEEDNLASLRKTVGLEKAEYFYGDIEALSKKGPVVVFAYHREVVAYLKDRLTQDGYKVGLIVGSMTAKQKAKVADEFQRGELDFIIANITSANAGITLTRSHVAAFIEQDWTAVKVFQAEKRVLRIGQTHPVELYYYMFDGDVDSLVVQTALNKEGKVSCVYHN